MASSRGRLVEEQAEVGANRFGAWWDRGGGLVAKK
jgi:hypothetical protein